MATDRGESGYVIAVDEIIDTNRFTDEYVPVAAETIEAYGGEVLVRSFDPDVLEGKWDHTSVIVVEFPSVVDAKAWYDDETYQVAAQVRRDACRYTNLVITPESGRHAEPSRWRSFHPAWASRDDG